MDEELKMIKEAQDQAIRIAAVQAAARLSEGHRHISAGEVLRVAQRYENYIKTGEG